MVPKQWFEKQLAWNKRITGFLNIVMPRDQRGELIPSMDSRDYRDYLEGLGLIETQEDILAHASRDRRSHGGSQGWLFDDFDCRA
jgi:hypothetical protein